MLAASLHDRTNYAECDHITIASDVHTAFLHAVVDQELFAEPPESDEWYESELREDEVWNLNKALYGCRKRTETLRRTACCKFLGKSEIPSTSDRSELFQK